MYNAVSYRLLFTDALTHSGNLSVRSLADIVPRDLFVQDSEYLETLLVAVPKWVYPLNPSSDRVFIFLT